MKEGKYRFMAFAGSRGKCEICEVRTKSCFLIRLREPFSAELRLCYNCAIDYTLKVMRRRERAGKKHAKMLSGLGGKK